ncbi:MAG: DUF4419 domain-containing protein, partial [bacterium]|nr:DUF4419 domain-containing protein [bacterium]
MKVHAAVATSNHYHLILTPEDADQHADFMEFVNGNLARLRYVLWNTIKENLVAQIADWEGLHCAEALIDGRPMTGTWYDRAIE